MNENPGNTENSKQIFSILGSRSNKIKFPIYYHFLSSAIDFKIDLFYNIYRYVICEFYMMGNSSIQI